MSITPSFKLERNYNKQILQRFKIIRNAKENYNKIKEKINSNKVIIDTLLSTSKEILYGKSVKCNLHISRVVLELSKLITLLKAIEDEFKVFNEFFNILVKGTKTNELHLPPEFSGLQKVTKRICDKNTPHPEILKLCKDSQDPYFEPTIPPASPTLRYHNFHRDASYNNLSRQSNSIIPPKS